MVKKEIKKTKTIIGIKKEWKTSVQPLKF